MLFCAKTNTNWMHSCSISPFSTTKTIKLKQQSVCLHQWAPRLTALDSCLLFLLFLCSQSNHAIILNQRTNGTELMWSENWKVLVCFSWISSHLFFQNIPPFLLCEKARRRRLSFRSRPQRSCFFSKKDDLFFSKRSTIILWPVAQTPAWFGENMQRDPL